MVLVSHKYKFIYIKNKKVAGSSVESFFGKYCLNPNLKYHYNDKIDEHNDEYGIIGSRRGGNATIWVNHKPAKEIKKELGDKMFNEYTKFCVIRNPYDKMVSKYFFRGAKTTFKEFIKNHTSSNINHYFIDKKSVCNYYIRYENLEKDIIELCKILGIENYNITELPNFKSTQRKNKNKHYSKYYDDETKSIVDKVCSKEFELFGYKFEIL